MTTATAVISPNAELQHISRVDNIPAATVQCHASHLLELPDKTLLCVWFGGTQEGCSDISIYLSRLEHGSTSWAKPVRVSSDPDRSEQNPVLFREPTTSRIWLFHTAQPAGNQDEALIIARVSEDDARTWLEPFEPFDGKKGAFIRQPMVVLPDGTWVLPIFYCHTPPGFRWVGNSDISAVMYTRDSGKTWSESAVPNSEGCVHMNIVALPSKKTYVAFFRSRWADNIYRATSEDGITWSSPQKTTLPNPNSGIGSAVLPNGDLVIIFNYSSASADMERRTGLYDDITPADDTRVNQPDVNGQTAIWGTPRKALSVGLSKDDGVTWKYRVLETGDGYCMTNNSKERSNRELSYPSIFVERNSESLKSVHIAYTYYRQHIKYVRVDDVQAFVEG